MAIIRSSARVLLSWSSIRSEPHLAAVGAILLTHAQNAPSFVAPGPGRRVDRSPKKYRQSVVEKPLTGEDMLDKQILGYQ